jgi:hypothetical protein
MEKVIRFSDIVKNPVITGEVPTPPTEHLTSPHSPHTHPIVKTPVITGEVPPSLMIHPHK